MNNIGIGLFNCFSRPNSPPVPPEPDTYVEKVLKIKPSNIIGYWPMSEHQGNFTVEDVSPNGYNGLGSSYLGSFGPSPDGEGAPLFYGTQDQVTYNNNGRIELSQSGFNDDYDGSTGSFAIWFKLSNLVGQTGIYYPYKLANFVSNEYLGFTSIFDITWYGKVIPTDSYIVIKRNTSTLRTISGITDLNWHHIAVTWKVYLDEFRVYYDGDLVTGGGMLPGWSGGIKKATIGSSFKQDTDKYDGTFQGYLAHAILWDEILTQEDVTNLVTIP